MAPITDPDTISVWFECKSCQLTFPFPTVDQFLDHKKQKHFGEFQKISCIVFEERKQEDELFANSDQNIETNLFSQDNSDEDIKLCSIAENPQPQITSTVNASKNLRPAFSFADDDDVDRTVDDNNQVLFNEPRDWEPISNFTFKNADSPPQNPFVLLQRLTANELPPSSKIIVNSNRKANKLNTSKPSKKTKETQRGPFICPICPKSIKTKGALVLHMKSHWGMESGPQPFKCPYPDCQYNYTTKRGLYQHKKRHENSSYNTNNNTFFKFPGPESDTDPLTFREWLIEQKTSEKSNSSDPEAVVNIIRLDPDPTAAEAFEISGETPTKCKLCRKNLKSEAEVKVHVTHCWLRNKLRHCYCLPCNKTLSSPLTLRNHNNVFHPGGQQQQRRVKVKVHSCHLCPRKFSWSYGLKQHLDAHTRKEERALQPFVCEICGKTFTEMYLLKSHQLSHVEERPFKCSHPDCELAFKTKYVLTDHAKIHTESKLFTCPKEGCSSRFKTQKVLYSHLKTLRHTGVFLPKSWKCDQENCGKLYIHKLSLDRHMIAAHGIGGELPTFECEICKKTFTWRVLYNLHVRAHTQEISFKCHYEGCEKVYKKKSTLVEHIRAAHTGEQPFVCHLCGKAYHRSMGLKWHMGVHKKSKLKE